MSRRPPFSDNPFPATAPPYPHTPSAQGSTQSPQVERHHDVALAVASPAELIDHLSRRAVYWEEYGRRMDNERYRLLQDRSMNSETREFLKGQSQELASAIQANKVQLGNFERSSKAQIDQLGQIAKNISDGVSKLAEIQKTQKEAFAASSMVFAVDPVFQCNLHALQEMLIVLTDHVKTMDRRLLAIESRPTFVQAWLSFWESIGNKLR